MDAHVFRHISRIIGDLLQGARLERIHEPLPGLTVFSLFRAGHKRCLMLRAHRTLPLFFLAEQPLLPNPPFPPARVMRLRKHAEGRILGRFRVNWTERRMAFALPGPHGETASWLLLDCKHGPDILARLPENFDSAPSWPDVEDAMRPDAWKVFPALTPRLRDVLGTLSSRDAAALLVDLEDGGGDLFWYGKKDAPLTVSAWPLSPEPGVWEKIVPPTAESVLPLLEALQLPLLLEAAREVSHAPEEKQLAADNKKRARLLHVLEQEKKRLTALLALGDDARLLQAHLWALEPDAPHETVTLPRDPANPEGDHITLILDPTRTVTENMQNMFRKAARAARGLGILEKRLTLAREAPFFPSKQEATLPPPKQHMRSPREPKKHAGKKPPFPPSLVQEFFSSDGFPLWRGRSAEGNRALLTFARPFDLWCHVEDGPSAHLLIRRDHAAQAVPESTLREAAVLAGLKSWRKNDAKVPVMFALAKNVHPLKGAGPGTVRVHERLQTLLVALDPALAERLKEKPCASPG